MSTAGITLFGCPVTTDYLQLLEKSAGYNPADESGIVKIVATDDGKVTVHWDDGTTSELVNSSAAGSSTFDGLSDTPSSKSGQATKGLRVNSAETSLEYVGIATAGHTHDDRYYTETETDSFLSAKADKVTAVTTGNFAGLDASGNLTDSGYSHSSFSSAGHTHSWTDVSKTGSKLSDIADVPAYTASKVLGVDSSGTTLQWVSNAGSTAGATDFDGLSDTPSSKSGNAYKLVAVNSSATSLVYIDREDVWEGTMYTKKVDYDANGNPQYEGWAAPGSSTSSAVWRIKKIEYNTAGSTTGEVWADGNTNFDNTWDSKSAISTWS